MRLESLKDTLKAGEKIGKMLCLGDLVLLGGEMGAGKTSLTQGIARGLGLKTKVTSPTFVKLQIHEGKIRLYHWDFYRLESMEELDELGAWETFHPKDGVCVIEWWEKFESAFRSNSWKIRLTKDGSHRHIEWEFPSRG